MRYQLRIIAGRLRGRKLALAENPELRPLADRPRGALFSILGDAVPGRPFFDVFAGSGAVGIEALSRGAEQTVFVERDGRAVASLIQHLEKFGVAGEARVLRADAYRWADHLAAPAEPVNVFLGPPYREFQDHADALDWMIRTLMHKLAPGSVMVVQSDQDLPASLPEDTDWDVRTYGRTQLAIWTKPFAPLGQAEPAEAAGQNADERRA